MPNQYNSQQLLYFFFSISFLPPPIKKLNGSQLSPHFVKGLTQNKTYKIYTKSLKKHNTH